MLRFTVSLRMYAKVHSKASSNRFCRRCIASSIYSTARKLLVHEAVSYYCMSLRAEGLTAEGLTAEGLIADGPAS